MGCRCEAEWICNPATLRFAALLRVILVDGCAPPFRSPVSEPVLRAFGPFEEGSYSTWAACAAAFAGKN